MIFVEDKELAAAGCLFGFPIFPIFENISWWDYRIHSFTVQ